VTASRELSAGERIMVCVTQYKFAECICCRLIQRLPDRIGETDRERTCVTCAGHPGPTLELKRAQDHEALIREKIDAADRYARRAEGRVANAKDQTAAALDSRNRALTILRDLSDLHMPRMRGGCSCGRTGRCETSERLSSKWVQQMVSRLRGDDFM
jgi:hypothetical protein